jgi:hypothetical protein
MLLLVVKNRWPLESRPCDCQTSCETPFARGHADWRSIGGQRGLQSAWSKAEALMLIQINVVRDSLAFVNPDCAIPH